MVLSQISHSWARSTKTRIETSGAYYRAWYDRNSWARSTKTRIETKNSQRWGDLSGIREQDPLKQGLKRGWRARICQRYQIREQDPLKQGLKLINIDIMDSWNQIREQDPLKQGLKLITCSTAVQMRGLIREQDPLKQGLKPVWPLNVIVSLSFVSKIH